MTAQRGRVPKRDSQRRRRNKPATPTETPVETGKVEVPPAENSWHPVAQDWYRSLAESGQSQYFEPSDWQAARFVAQAMTENLNAGKFGAQLFAAVWSAMGELLTTEGARRRVRVEVERMKGDPDEDAAVAEIDEYRRRQAK